MKKMLKGKLKKALSALMAVVITATSINLSGLNVEAASAEDRYTAGYDIATISSLFQFFVEGDAVNVGHTIGAVAVGGNFENLDKYNNSYFGSISPTASYVNNWTSGKLETGRNYANATMLVYYNTINESLAGVQENDKGEAVYNPEYMDINKAFTSIRGQSKSIADNSEPFDGTELDLTNVTSDVFIKISPEQMRTFNVKVKDLSWFVDHTLIVSVVGVGASPVDIGGTTGPTINGKAINSNFMNDFAAVTHGEQAESKEYNKSGLNLYWNYPDADGYVNMYGMSGHVIAPKASVYSSDIYNGSIIAQEIRGLVGEGHYYPSSRGINVPPYTPPSDDIGSLKGKKVDDNGQALGGAVIGIYSDASCNDEMQRTTSKSDGSFLFNDLPVGTYYVKEISPKEGYEASTKVYGPYEIKKNVITTMTEDIVNKKETVTGSIKFKKVDQEGYAALSGAEFGLYYSEANAKDDNSIPIAKAKSNAQGFVNFYNLTPRDYWVKELTAPTNYEKSADVKKFTVIAGQTVGSDQVFVNKKKVVPTPTPGTDEKATIRVYKKAGSIYGEALAGAELKLTKENDTLPTGITVTGVTPTKNDSSAVVWSSTNNYAEIAGLTNGDYELLETKAPEGYIAASSDTYIKFNVLDGKVTFTSKGDSVKDYLVSGNNITLANNKVSADIVFTKVNGDNHVLESAKFTIYTDESCTSSKGTVASDKNGIVKFSGLTAGTYYIKETTAPAGYRANSDVYTVTVNSDGTVTYDDRFGSQKNPKLVNMLKAKTEFRKVDQDGKPLVGAEFKITYYNDSNVLTELGTYISDADGYVSIPELKHNKTHYVKETKAPEGYVKSEKEYRIIVGSDGKVRFENFESVNSVNVVRNTKEPDKASIEFYKTDETGKVFLRAAKFGLYTTSNCSDTPRTVSSTGDGAVTFAGLSAGTYYIKEITAPTGYIAASTIYQVVVKADGIVEYDSKFGSESKKKVKNEPITGDIRFTKISNDTNPVKLSGAKFTLYDSEGNVIVKDVVSDTDGKVVITNIKPGAYYLQETTAPSGYVLNSQMQYHLTINDTGNTSYGERFTGTQADPTIKNTPDGTTPKYGNIRFTKVDENETSKTLSGAVFELRKDSVTGSVVRTSSATKADGVVEFNDIAIGTYYVVEKTAPTGYRKTNAEYKVVISEAANSTEVSVAYSDAFGNDDNKVVKNTKIVGNIEFLKVDDNQAGLANAVFGLHKDSASGALVGTYVTTHTDGVVRFNDIEVGEYVVVEHTVPTGYKADKDKTYKVTVSDNGTVTYSGFDGTKDGKNYIKNTRIHADIEFTKVDKDDASKVLAGATFELREDYTTKLVDTATSTADGKVSFENIGLGKYYIVETVASTGYVLDDATQYTVEVKDTGVVVYGKEFTDYGSAPKVKNAPIIVTFSKEKTGAVGPEIPGATIKLTAKNEIEKFEGVVFERNNEVVPTTDRTLDANTVTWTSTEHEFVIKNLPAGEYTMHEVAAPRGYAVATDVSFKVDEKGNIEVTGVEARLADTVKAEAKKGIVLLLDDAVPYVGKIKIEKTFEGGSVSDAVLSATKFGVYSDAECTTKVADGVVIKEEGKYVFNYTIPDLNLHEDNQSVKYYVKEIETDAAYVTSNDTYEVTFTLKKDGATYKLDTVYKKGGSTVTNPVVNNVKVPSNGAIKFYKVNGNDENLSGAKFELFKVGGTSLGTVTTDATGVVEFKNLEAGSYYIVEKDAPKGYKIDSTQRQISIDTDGKATYSATDFKDANTDAPKVVDETIEVRFSKKATKEAGDEIKGATISLIAKDTSETFAGVVFERNNAVVPTGERTVDANTVTWTSTEHEFVIKNLPVGEYTMHEVAAPKGYAVATDITFTVKEDGALDAAEAYAALIDKSSSAVMMVDDAVPYEGKIKIEKTFEGGSVSDAVLSATKFGVYTDAACKTNVAEDAVVKESDKYVFNYTIADLDLHEADKAVTYYVKEIATDTTTYNMSADVYAVTFTLKKTGTGYTLDTVYKKGGSTVTNPVVNNVKVPSNSAIKFYKVNGNDEKLSGAIFELHKADTDKTLVGTSVTTDSTGVVEFKNLEAGDYYVVETKAPKGYKLDKTERKISIATEGKVTYTTTDFKDANTDAPKVVNEAIEVSFSKRKTDAAGEEIPGAKIILTAKDTNETFDGVVFERNGSVVPEEQREIKDNTVTWTSTEKEFIIKNLPAGEYTMHEVAAPSGYAVATDIVFTVKDDGALEAAAAYAELIDNSSSMVMMIDDAVPFQGEISIEKTFEDGLTADKESSVLAATKFGVYSNPECTTKVDEGVIEKEAGKYVFKYTIADLDLHEAGKSVTYYVKEIATDNTYNISKDVYSVTFTLKKDGATYTLDTVYKNGDNTVTNPTVNNTLKPKNGDIKFYKVNGKGANLSGATFELFKDDATKTSLGTVTTDATGVVEFKGLSAGNYYVVETEAPKGYKLDSTERKITVDTKGKATYVNGFKDADSVPKVENQSIDVIFSKEATNAVGKEIPNASLTLTAKDTTETEPFSGVVFERSGKTVPSNEYKVTGNIIEWTSKTDPFVIKNLPAGKYQMDEVAAPNGYAVATSIKLTVDNEGKITVEGVDAALAEAQTQKATLGIVLMLDDAVPTQADIKITKKFDGDLAGLTDAEKKAVLSATKFGVFKDADCTQKAYGTNVGSVGDDLTFKFTAKDLGLSKVGATKVLYVTETSAASGYIKSTEKYAVRFTLVKDTNYSIKVEYKKTTDSDYSETVPTIRNARVANVEFFKVDASDNTIKLNGAKFALYKDSACAGPVVQEFESGNSGVDGKVVFEGLASGQYWIKEISEPDNYVLSNKLYKVVVNTDTNPMVEYQDNFKTGSTGTGEVCVENTPMRTYQFSKEASDVAGKEIPGATIKLTSTVSMKDVEQVSGPTVARKTDGTMITWTSGEEPVVLKGLLPGTYVMHEDAAPNGYLVQTDITFVVDSTGKATATGLDSKIGSVTPGVKNLIKMVDDAIPSVDVELEKLYQNDDGTAISATTDVLTNTEFSIYLDEDCNDTVLTGIKPVVSSGKNIVKYSISGDAFTKKNGYKLTYYIKETKTPAGFIVDNKVYKCELVLDTNRDSSSYNTITKTYSIVGETGTSSDAPKVTNKKLPDTPVDKSVIDISKVALKLEGPELEGATLVLSVNKNKSSAPVVDFSSANTTITTAGGGTNVTRTADSITWISGLSPERITGLPDGYYQLEETVAPAGYAKNPKQTEANKDTVKTIIYFAINGGKLVESGDDKPTSTSDVIFAASTPAGERAGVIKLVNDALKTRVELSKKNTGALIPGAKMRLELETPDSSIDLRKVYRLSGGTDFVAKEDEITWTTTSVQIVLSNMPDKVYKLIEVEPPVGYLPADPIIFKTYDGKITEINGVDVSLLDEHDVDMLDLTDPNFTKIKFVKADNVDSTMTLKGAKFELFKDSACTISLGTAITDENGVAEFAGIEELGYVYLKEIAPPEGYTCDTSLVYPLEITRTVDTRIVNFGPQFKENSTPGEPPILGNPAIPNPGSISGIKYGQVDDDASTRAKLAGAVIGLFTSDSVSATKANAYRYTTSKADGSFEFKNLPDGTYYVREISAPSGYSIDTTWTKCVIDGSHKTVTGINVINKKTGGKGGDDPKKDPKDDPKKTPKETPKKDSTSKNNSSKPSGNGLMINPGIKTGDKGLLWFLN